MEEVKGQEIARKFLSSIINSGKLPSTLLFSGPPGVGKFLMALHFAAELLDDKKKTLRGTHPDLSVVFPDFEGYEKNEIMNLRMNKEYFKLRQKKGSISIDMVRKLQDYVHITPMESKWRIVVIVHADRMTTEAINAFLKILEEPPSNVIFILITPEKLSLPQTIISRSQYVNFNPLPIELQKEILKDESINRFGRGIEETLFLNSQKNMEKKIEEMFFDRPAKSRIKNWSEEITKEWKIEFVLQYLQKLAEDKYKNKEITFNKAWTIFYYLKNAYLYYYSNIGPEKIIFFLLLKV
jgi:DNA polymerase III delta prime subunit